MKEKRAYLSRVRVRYELRCARGKITKIWEDENT